MRYTDSEQNKPKPPIYNAIYKLERKSGRFPVNLNAATVPIKDSILRIFRRSPLDLASMAPPTPGPVPATCTARDRQAHLLCADLAIFALFRESRDGNLASTDGDLPICLSTPVGIQM